MTRRKKRSTSQRAEKRQPVPQMKHNACSTNMRGVSRSRLVPSLLPAKNPEEEKAQKKKDGHLYSTGPPAWTAVETHVAALQGRKEGPSKRARKKRETRGWEKKIVSDD